MQIFENDFNNNKNKIFDDTIGILKLFIAFIRVFSFAFEISPLISNSIDPQIVIIRHIVPFLEHFYQRVESLVQKFRLFIINHRQYFSMDKSSILDSTRLKILLSFHFEFIGKIHARERSNEISVVLINKSYASFLYYTHRT